MIPRLWQCEEPSWWEQALSAPFSLYAVGALLVAAAVLSLFRLPGGRVVTSLLAGIAATPSEQRQDPADEQRGAAGFRHGSG